MENRIRGIPTQCMTSQTIATVGFAIFETYGVTKSDLQTKNRRSFTSSSHCGFRFGNHSYDSFSVKLLDYVGSRLHKSFDELEIEKPDQNRSFADLLNS